MNDFDWPDVSYFQAKFGWERVKASKVGGGLVPPCFFKWLYFAWFCAIPVLWSHHFIK